jgi:hypothetical protein
MTQNMRILFLFLIFLLIVLAPLVSFKWQVSRSVAFCRTVAMLPSEQLASFSSHCGELYTNSYKSYKNGSSVTITDKQTLDQFVLAGKSPVDIHIYQGMVNVEYLHSGHTAAAIQWTDHSPWGEPIWKLESHTLRGRLTLYEPKQHTQ